MRANSSTDYSSDSQPAPAKSICGTAERRVVGVIAVSTSIICMAPGVEDVFGAVECNISLYGGQFVVVLEGFDPNARLLGHYDIISRRSFQQPGSFGLERALQPGLV